MVNDSHNSVRCGIVLAAGEGERLRPFVQRLRGDALPKQYVNFIGSRSLLEHTFGRAERLISPEHLFTVVSQNHLRHPQVKQQLSSRPSGTVVVQPENKETGPGILLPLMHVYKRYPDSGVAVFPSDHFIVEEALFMAHVDLALRVVERHPSCLVLLGMEPRGPEPEYGYILPGPKENGLSPLAVRPVLRFVEKPNPHAARLLIRGGGLWNTMVMIFKIRTMLDLVQKTAPLLYRVFMGISKIIGTMDEMRVVEDAYRKMAAVNFSRGVLEPITRADASRLLVLPVRNVFWSDWGSERRILSVLGRAGNPELHHGTSQNEPFSALDDRRRAATGSG